MIAIASFAESPVSASRVALCFRAARHFSNLAEDDRVDDCVVRCQQQVHGHYDRKCPVTLEGLPHLVGHRAILRDDANVPPISQCFAQSEVDFVSVPGALSHQRLGAERQPVGIRQSRDDPREHLAAALAKLSVRIPNFDG